MSTILSFLISVVISVAVVVLVVLVVVLVVFIFYPLKNMISLFIGTKRIFINRLTAILDYFQD
jgi:hypothetical protein